MQLFEEITLSAGEQVTPPAPGIRVSPNPVNDVARLELNLPMAGEYQFVVYSQAGKLVWTSAASLSAGISNFQIPTENWQAGVYFLSLNSTNSSKRVKILKL